MDVSNLKKIRSFCLDIGIKMVVFGVALYLMLGYLDLTGAEYIVDMLLTLQVMSLALGVLVLVMAGLSHLLIIKDNN